MLTRLIYYSENNLTNGLEDIRQILKSSKINNKALAITGTLFFNETYFIQILEGSRTTVSELYSKISKDNRHKNLVLVSVNTIRNRDFANWSMLYLEDSEIGKEELLRFSPQNTLKPDVMTSENILDYLLYLKNEKEPNGVI